MSSRAYATNMVAPAIPVVMQKGKTFISLFALDANSEFHYPKYFSMLPTGPDTKASFTEGFFQVAMQQNPKPTTVALASEDAEFARNACDGARENAKRYGFNDRLRQDLPAGHDRLLAGRPRAAGRQCRPRGGVLLSAELGRHRAVRERARLHAEDARRRHGRPAGDRVQGQAEVEAQRHRQLRDLGAVAETDGAGGGRSSRSTRQRAKAAGVDPLGYYLGGWGYAYLQVLGEAVKGANSINDDKIADYLRSHEFNTIMADVRFGKNGEWTKSGMLQVQYHGITDAANLDTWRGMSYQTVLTPADQKTGDVIYPYAKAKAAK